MGLFHFPSILINLISSPKQLSNPNLPLPDVNRIIGAVSHVVPGWEALLVDIQSARRKEPLLVPRPFVIKVEPWKPESVALLNTIKVQLEACKQLIDQLAEMPGKPSLENLLTELAEQGNESLKRLRSFIAMETAPNLTAADLAVGGDEMQEAGEDHSMSAVDAVVEELCVVEKKVAMRQGPEVPPTVAAAATTTPAAIKTKGTARRCSVARVLLDDVFK